MQRLRLGHIEVDAVTFDGALDEVERLVREAQGGSVFTPNVDHIVQAEHDERLRAAYRNASLSLADGMPLLWASKLLGRPLPEKVSGSDFFEPLMARAAALGWRVFLLGGCDDRTSAEAAQKLVERGVNVVGRDSSWISDPTNEPELAPILERVAQTRPELLVVALGAPKQELLIHSARKSLGRTVAIGLGATLEFFTGRTPRAPRWMSAHGLEWLYRLTKDPARLWRRYLLRDPAFVRIVARELTANRRTRLLPAPQRNPA